MTVQTIQTFCQNCHMKCRLFCRVKEGRLTHVANAMGVSGEKAEASIELIYHPDRVIYPLKRVGERGEGKWKRISWDEALDIMAERFRQIKEKYGGEAIATIWTSGHRVMASAACFMFSQATGTPNILDMNQQCDLPLDAAQQTTFGENILSDQTPYFKYCKCALLWGSNTRHNRDALDKDINFAQTHGAKVIRVDPRPPETLDLDRLGLPAADIWLRVRPGTDAALALGMINVIINEGLYNKEFVDKWCVGFEELKKHVQDYPVEKVAEITWVPKEKIIEAARLFATTHPSCVQARLGVGSQQVNATQAARTVCILRAITGDIDIRGGNLLGHGEIGDEVRRFKPTFPPGVEEKRLGAKEFPLFAGSKETVKDFNPPGYTQNQLGLQAMLDGDIKAFYIPACNIVVGEGDSKKTIATLKSLDFLVVVDFFMTPTAELADLVLPPAHFFETEIPMRAYQNMGPRYMNYILTPRKVIEPVGDCWDDRKIVMELAKRMKVSLPWQNIEEHNNWLVEKFGVKYKDIRNKPNQMISWPLEYERYEKNGFRTPSGKIELSASILKNHGYDSLPSHIEPPQSPISTPELYKDYPLILTNHRSIVYTHTEYRQLPSLRKKLPEPLLEINPETAAGLGIEEGDELFIETPGFKERVYMKAQFSSGIHHRVVSCVPLWWFPEKPGPEHGCFKSNINTIISTDPPYDPISMNYQMRAVLCRVGKSI
ncbi:Acetylene hydratase [subsurface metagenome]